MIEGVSRRALAVGSSGTYHVRASELAREQRGRKSLAATVTFLDDSQHTFQLEKRAKGQALLDLVFRHLELVEKDYFGMQFSDSGQQPSPANSDLMRWLDPLKLLKKQLRGGGQFYFRVKFYVGDPSKLQEEYTRYQFFLQLRRDLLTGRLHAPPASACLLASYAVQSELGDYHPDDHAPGYLRQLQLMPGQCDEMEKKVAELHKLHKGQTPADAEFNFLDHVKRLEMYGVDLHRARDGAGKELQLGVSSLGLVVFQHSIRINLFSWSKIVKISFKRKQFFIQLRRETEDYDTLLGFGLLSYRSCKNLWKSCVEHHTFFRLHTPRARHRRFLLFSLGSRFRYSGRTEFQTVQESRRRARLQERPFVRSPSHKARLAEDKGKSIPLAPSVTSGAPRASRDNKVQSLGPREPRKAWEQDRLPSDDEGGFLERGDGPFTPVLPVRGPQGQAPVAEQPAFDLPPYLDVQESAAESLVIRMTPDAEGRFGFNVKGGADLQLPVLVSRVAPNTPADRCFPRLSEGDQVLLINDQDVSDLTHEQVVALIRSCSIPGEHLELAVRQNVYEARNAEEPAFQYVLDAPAAPHVVGGAAALAESLLLLAEGLESGAALAQFEQLYRKKPGMAGAEARRQDNQNKNRYKDIAPYDSTRVVLRGADSGDYINANLVSMEVPGSGVVNRYIATQGPLPNTVEDFWQMVLEAGSTLVVMLTTLVERGRVKCHKYWPEPSEGSMQLAGLSLTCTQHTEEPGFAFREFLLVSSKTGEERQVSHMQYLAWPDHEVPADCADFLRFCSQVRAARAGTPEPVVVHCSAGIGRTGVLVLMETAMCLIEANEPVYPLDLVRAMRDQRAMMIQTASQYRFVCDSVQRAFHEKVVEPLPQYQREQ